MVLAVGTHAADINAGVNVRRRAYTVCACLGRIVLRNALCSNDFATHDCGIIPCMSGTFGRSLVVRVLIALVIFEAFVIVGMLTAGARLI